jgi:hypothetical protein
MKTRIHVNQHIIKKNNTTGHRTPPLTVKNYKTNTRAREVFIAGPCRVVYMPDKPLDCGARVWIETESVVLVDDEIPETTVTATFAEAWRNIEKVRPQDVLFSIYTQDKIRAYEERIQRPISMFTFTTLTKDQLLDAVNSIVAADEIEKVLRDEFGWGLAGEAGCRVAVSVTQPKKVTKSAGKTKNKVKVKAAKKAKAKPRAARLSRRG